MITWPLHYVASNSLYSRIGPQHPLAANEGPLHHVLILITNSAVTVSLSLAEGPYTLYLLVLSMVRATHPARYCLVNVDEGPLRPSTNVSLPG